MVGSVLIDLAYLTQTIYLMYILMHIKFPGGTSISFPHRISENPTKCPSDQWGHCFCFFAGATKSLIPPKLTPKKRQTPLQGQCFQSRFVQGCTKQQQSTSVRLTPRLVAQLFLVSINPLHLREHGKASKCIAFVITLDNNNRLMLTLR